MKQITTLDLSDAQNLVEYILTVAMTDGLAPVCIVVGDVAGNPLALATIDGCAPAAITVALAKVRTVIQSGGKPTMDYATREGFDPANWADPRLTAFGGGVPVRSPHDGSLIGAVGVSGRSPEQDAKLASLRPTGWTP